MTDHAESFDLEKLDRYIAECRVLSDADFCFVPGLEFACEQHMHILGYGATRLAHTRDPQQVIEHIDESNAISVIAHPKDEHFSWIESFGVLPRGIETWNSKYDGRYAPRPATFAMLQRLRGRKPEMQAFYGQDLHWKQQFHELFIKLNVDRATPGVILQALRTASYQGWWNGLDLPSSGVLPEHVLERFAKDHLKSDRVRAFLKNGKRTLDGIGLKVPAAVKRQLRRIF